jgi:peptide/nickel transport system permease protein
MSRYLAQRLLILLPSLWIITSLVFIFNKIAFEQTAFSIEEEEPALRYGTVNTTARQRALRQYLHRTGQDLPVFYLSIGTWAEPDTLHRILSFRDRAFLQKMLLAYGNWPPISAYYQRLLRLENAPPQALTPPLRKQWNQQIAALFRNAEAKQNRQHLHAMGRLAVSRREEVAALSAQWDEVVQTQQPWKNWIPSVRWNGLQNQYHRWLSGLLQGDLGHSTRDAVAVTHIIAEALSNTWLLIGAGLGGSFGLALVLGLGLSLPAGKKWQPTVLNGLYLVDTIPLFLLSLLIVLLLISTGLSRYLPTSLSYVEPEENLFIRLFSTLYQQAVPITCLIIASLPYLTRQVHQAIGQVLPRDYIRTARAKGLPESVVVGRHALRNALLPLITLLTGFLPAFIGGVLVVEVIFSIPGMGRLLADSVMARDYPVIMGIVLCLALVKMLSLLLADALYYLADPRIRFR